MRIKKSRLEQIVREELVRHLSESLAEAPKKPDDEPEVADAAADKKGKGPDKKGTEPQADPDNITTRPKTTGAPAGAPKGEPPTQELPADPADDELDKDAAEPEGEEEDPTDSAQSDISDDISGKTVQSITMEPKSKIMPGAVEVNVTFKEVADTLRILVSKSGAVKFYWKGLHNEL